MSYYCVHMASVVQCQNRFLNKVPFNNKYVELWILTGPGLKYEFGDTVDVQEMELQSRKIKIIAL